MGITAKVVTNPEVKTSLQNNTVTKTVGIQRTSKVQDSFSIDASQIPVSLDNSTATNVRDALNDTATANASQTLSNKTIDADNNTISNLEVDNLKSGVLDSDLSSVASTDTTLPSAKAVKTYIDGVESNINASITAQDLDFQADTGGALNIDLDSESLTIAGGTGINTTGSGNQVSVAVDNTIATKTYVDNTVSGEDTLSEMNDTNITDPNNCALLQYDSASSKWIDVDEISGGTFI
tara:strand:- start:38 stop:748 length:711 start_codon:yes stop_codon:yes gene_type:complete